MPKLRRRRKVEPEAANPLLAADRAGRDEPEPEGGNGMSTDSTESRMNGDSGAVAEVPADTVTSAGAVAEVPADTVTSAPPPPPPMRDTGPDAGNGGVTSRVMGVYANPGSTAAQRDAQAAAEFQAAIAPVMDLLSSTVPEAGSSEEAMRTLEGRLGEYTPDPDGGAYIRGDSYETDARVYYRLLRRDYERDPRPAKGPRTPWRTLPSAWRGP